MQNASLSRRAVLAGAAALATPWSRAADDKPSKLKVAIFSKHLQFLQGDALAAGAAEIGFDGIDITVRKGGHVAPERVKQDLPALVKTIRQHRLEVPMITTDIVDAETPFTDDLLQAASEQGIRYYRFGGFKWNETEPFPQQLEKFKPRLAKLAERNAKYQTCAIYHTHSGAGLVGASIWDLHILMRDLDPKAIGINYDVGHATIEGGLGGWIASFKISGPHLRGIAVKDFVWGKDAKGAWQAQWKPIGEGMVHWPQFMGMVAAAHFSGPVQLHFEYPLGGANNGTAKLTIPQEQVFAAMKSDLGKIRAAMAQANL